MPGERFQVYKPNVIHEVFDDEVVIINLKTGSYFSLEKVGADIWILVDSGVTVDEIVEGIAHRYEASRGDVENSVRTMLKEFQREELIVPRTGTIASGKPSTQILTQPGEKKLSFETPVLRKYTDMEELLLLDPIHEVDEMGWPSTKQDEPK
jgi:Coenzyme PQQ synthesis protein D (PqqD)